MNALEACPFMADTGTEAWIAQTYSTCDGLAHLPNLTIDLLFTTRARCFSRKLYPERVMTKQPRSMRYTQDKAGP